MLSRTLVQIFILAYAPRHLRASLAPNAAPQMRNQNAPSGSNKKQHKHGEHPQTFVQAHSHAVEVDQHGFAKIRKNMVRTIRSTGPEDVTGPRECVHNRTAALANYRSGDADLWFYHITHHGGTTLYSLAKHNGLEETEDGRDGFLPHRGGKHIHMWGETMHGVPGKLPPQGLQKVLPCNSDNFVSMIIMRDPLSRILSSDGSWTTSATEHTEKCNTDNYGLRWLIGKSIQKGTIADADLDLAKARLDMFDVVLITENISETATLLCRSLGWKDCRVDQKHHSSPAKILPADLLETWTQRNQFDIELYKYAVQKSATMMADSRPESLQENAGTKAAAVSLDATRGESHLGWIC